MQDKSWEILINKEIDFCPIPKGKEGIRPWLNHVNLRLSQIQDKRELSETIMGIQQKIGMAKAASNTKDYPKVERSTIGRLELSLLFHMGRLTKN